MQWISSRTPIAVVCGLSLPECKIIQADQQHDHARVDAFEGTVFDPPPHMLYLIESNSRIERDKLVERLVPDRRHVVPKVGDGVSKEQDPNRVAVLLFDNGLMA